MTRRMDGFFSELERRNVFRVADMYAVVGWILAQIATTLEESLDLPAWLARDRNLPPRCAALHRDVHR